MNGMQAFRFSNHFRSIILKNINLYSIKAIALFDGGKGLLVLVGVSLFIFVYHLDAHALAETLINRFHLDPTSNYPHKLLMLSTTVSAGRLMMVCVCAYLYSAIKLSEAYGLWYEFQWGRTIGILSIGVLIPFEFYEVLNQYSRQKMLVLLINIAIVAILFIGFGRKVKKN